MVEEEVVVLIKSNFLTVTTRVEDLDDGGTSTTQLVGFNSFGAGLCSS